MSPVETTPKDRSTVLAEERTDMALERTIMAADRSLMAWVRTSISMIGFGFSIYKFFQYVPNQMAADTIRRPNAPRNLGLTLIALGTLSLAASAIQHRVFLHAIGASKMRHLGYLSFLIALAVVVIGCIAFYGVLLHTGPF